jgi:hypothetical protein
MEVLIYSIWGIYEAGVINMRKEQTYENTMAPNEKEMEKLNKEMEQLKENKTDRERDPKQHKNNHKNEKE